MILRLTSKDTLCYLDFFGANLSAFVVAFAAPRAMWLIHNLQALQHVFDAAIKDVPVRSDNGCWTHIWRIFFLVDGAGGDAAGAHYAFYVVIKLEALLNGLQVFFALFRFSETYATRWVHRFFSLKKRFHIHHQILYDLGKRLAVQLGFPCRHRSL